FSGLPVARAGLGASFARHFLTPPELDPAAIAAVLGLRAITAASPSAVAAGVAGALREPGVTVIHAPASASGAHEVGRAAIERLAFAPARSTREAVAERDRRAGASASPCRRSP